MNTLNVALDVVREVIARRTMIALFVIITLGLVGLASALDLQVVDGALAGSRLFGVANTKSVLPLDQALAPVFQGFAWVVFYLGLLFGIVSTADIAPNMLAPGRVELLLSLPVRRAELIAGTYLGVMGIAVVTTSFAVTGIAGVLFVKAHFFTAAPFIGGACAIVGFMAVYGAMLLTASIVRSSALSAGMGIFIYIASLLTSNREWFLSLFSSPVVKVVMQVLITPLPRLMALAELGGSAAASGEMSLSVATPLIIGALVFGAATTALAALVVQNKDY
jgi:Cu-processing system permease protein